MRRAFAAGPTAASLLIVLALVILPSLVTPASAAPAPASDDDPEALDAVRRAALGSATFAFAGTRVVAAWPGGPAQMVDVVQRPGGARIERLRAASTTQSSPTYAPGGGTAVQAGARRFALAVLADNYSIRSRGPAIVAGHVATIVDVQDTSVAGGGRTVARLWIDRQHGIVLRQEGFDRSGEMARMSAFLDLSYSPVLAPLQPSRTRLAAVSGGAAALTTPADGTRTWSVGLCGAIRRQGYPCPSRLPGGLHLVDVRWSQPTSPAPAVHLTYTDGLSGVSVFVQRGRLAENALSGGRGWARRTWGSASVAVAQSAPTRLVWQGDSHVYTVVAQGPASDLRDVVEALPHRAPDPGLPAELIGAVRDAADRLSGR